MVLPVSAGGQSQGCAMAVGSADGVGQQMQLVQVIPQAMSGPSSLVPEPSTATGVEPRSVLSVLLECGLERHAEAMQSGGYNAIEALTNASDAELGAAGLTAEEVARLRQGLDQGRQKHSAQAQADGFPGGAVCMVPPGQCTGMPVQPVVMNGYGQWMPVSPPWGQVHMQPGVMHPGNQAMMQVLPTVPSFPVQQALQQSEQSQQPLPHQQSSPLVQTPRGKQVYGTATPSDDGREDWWSSPEKSYNGQRRQTPTAEVK